MKVTEKKISEKLRSLGVPPNVLGYRYLLEAIKLINSDPTYINQITKRLYPDIAKKYNSTSSKVERAIRHAIELAYTFGPYKELMALNYISHKDKPSNSKFMAEISEILKYENEESEETQE